MKEIRDSEPDLETECSRVIRATAKILTSLQLKETIVRPDL